MNARITRPPLASTSNGMTILEEIGRGAWSIVYRALHGDRVVALKMHTGPHNTNEALRRFRREAAIHASLQHRALPRLLDVGSMDGRAYIVSEYVEGVTLAEKLAQGRFTNKDVVEIGMTLADVLDVVHQHGIVHRDIKPLNILVASNGDLKLIDFGIAGQEIDSRDAGVGTMRYSAPEQIGMLQRVVDGRADLYALGCVLFECITGRCPFRADNISDLLHQHAAVRPERADVVEPRCTKSLANIIDRLLQKDPDERYASASDLLTDLIRLAPADSAPIQRTRRNVLVGCSDQLKVLQSHLTEASKSGTAVIVEGATGSGKTRLVEEALRASFVSASQVLHVQCTQSDPYPLAAVRGALTRWLRNLRRQPDAERESRIEMIRRELGERANLLHPLGSDIASLLGVAAPIAGLREAREVFHLAVASLLQIVVSPGRLILWVDDAQWIDDDSRAVLNALIAHHEERPFSLIVATRNDVPTGAALTEIRSVVAPMHPRTITLEALSMNHVAEIVEHGFGQSLDHGFVTQLAARSGGNPMMVGQYLQALKEVGALQPCWGNWVIDVDAMASVPLPSSAMDLLMNRLSHLTDQSREVLSIAALIGSETSLQHLSFCCESIGIQDVQMAVAEGIEAKLIEASTLADGFGFVHDRIRDVLANSYAGDGSLVHRRAAEYLDAMSVLSGRQVFERAFHAMRGAPHCSPEAVARACSEAASLALSDHAYGQAYELLTHIKRSGGLSTLDVIAQQKFHRSAGLACYHTERVGEASEHLLCALELAKNRFERVDTRLLLARVAISRLDTRDAAQQIATAFKDLSCELPSATISNPQELQTYLMGLLRRDLESASNGAYEYPDQDVRKVDLALAGLCEIGFLIGYLSRDLMIAMQYGILALAPAIRLGNAREACGALATFCLLMGLLGKNELVVRFSERALSIAKNLADRQCLATTQSSCATALHLAGNVDEALRLQREVFEVHGSWLGPVDYQTCCVDLAWNYYVRGYAREELDVSQAAIRRLEARGGTLMAGYICRASASSMAASATLGRTHATMQFDRKISEFRTIVPADRAVPWVSVTGFRTAMLLQQGELGTPMNEVAKQHGAWGVPPGRSPLHSKHFYLSHAYARYVILRRATADTAESALLECRKAVDDLAAAASIPTIRAHLRVLQGALLLHDGALADCANALNEARELAWEHDSPWVLYEEARVRARLLRARGLLVGARQQAQCAWNIADAHEWLPRRAKVEAEFNINIVHTEGTHTQSIADSCSTSSQHVHLRRQLDALLTLSRASSSILDPQEQARVALDESAQILGAERAYLFVIDEKSGRPAFQGGRTANHENLSEPTGYSRSIVDRAFDTGTAQVLSTRDDARPVDSESVIAYDLRSVLATPLMASDQVFGVLYLDNRLARGIFTREHAELARAIGQHIVTAMQTAKAAQLEANLRSEQQRRRLAETLRALIAHLSSTLNLSECLERLADALSRELRFDRCLMVVREDNRLETAVARGFSRNSLLGFPSEELLNRFSTLTGPYEFSGNDRWRDDREEPCLMLPLRSGEGLIGAVFLVRDDSKSSFDAADQELAITLASQVSIAIENASLFRRVRQLAEHDALTGVLNRGEFFRRAESVFKHTGAAIMFDVDHFKRFNDDHGHALGDEVLRLVARAAQDAIRSVDVIGRYGGEEFSVLLPDTGIEEAREVAERIRISIAQLQLNSGSVPISVTVSVGVAYTRTGENLQQLLSRADEALYISKRRGRNVVSVQSHHTRDSE
jgi:eukaryotic-like serine/threonine-protein kinase